MKEAAAKVPAKPVVQSLAQLLSEQPAAPPPGWIEPGLLPPEGILFVGGEDPVVAKTRTKVRDAQFVEEPGLKRALARYASP